MSNTTYDDVALAITKLTIAGEKITDKAIREALGGTASFSTISKFKHQFYAQLRENSRALFGPDIPETLIPILHGFWNEAIHHAGEHNLAEMNRLRERTEAAEGKARLSRLESDQHQRELQEEQRANMALQAENDTLLRELSQEKSVCDALRSEIQLMVTTHGEALQHRELEARQALNDAKTEAQRLVGECEVQLTEARAQLVAAKDNLKYERERSEAESNRLMRLVYDAREEARKAESKIRELQEYIVQAKKKADAEIHIASEKASAMSIKADRLQAEIDRRDREESGGE